MCFENYFELVYQNPQDLDIGWEKKKGEKKEKREREIEKAEDYELILVTFPLGWCCVDAIFNTWVQHWKKNVGWLTTSQRQKDNSCTKPKAKRGSTADDGAKILCGASKMVEMMTIILKENLPQNPYIAPIRIRITLLAYPKWQKCLLVGFWCFHPFKIWFLFFFFTPLYTLSFFFWHRSISTFNDICVFPLSEIPVKSEILLTGL